MTAIKSFTNIPQSEKLAEILPLESADMRIGNYIGKYACVDGTNVHYYYKNESFGAPEIIPCWSLAALLSILPNIKLCHYDDSYFCQYMGIGDEFPKYSTNEYNNSIDACYEMVLKLHELNLL